MIKKQNSPTTRLALRVFEVPKLLRLTCSFARISDCARLTRTCKTTFEGSAALVWSQVDGKNVLNLLSNTHIYGTQKASVNNKTVIRIASPTNFLRFDIYAPYVRTLVVYGPGPQYHRYQLENWSHLPLRSRQRPLLPNLSSIVLHSPTSTRGPNELDWIKLFFSPTLVDIQVIPNNIRSPTYALSSPTVDIILDTLAERCPRLLKLSLCPARIPISPKALGFFRGYKSLSSLTSLVELTCSMPMIESDSFRIISSFPALHQLTVLGLDSPVTLDPSSLSTKSFPSLRKLCISGLDGDLLSLILGVRPLMSHLTHLNIEYILDGNLNDDQGERIVCDLLSRLKNSPRLQSLELHLTSSEARDKPYDIGYDDLVGIFSKLPLQAITLAGVQLGELVYDLDFLRRAWPEVVSLSIPDQPGSLLVLRCFAELPSLQHLEVRLELGDLDNCPKEASRCQLRTLESSAFGTIGYNYEDLQPTGAALILIFPNLRRVLWPSSMENDPPEAITQRRFVERLNRHIALGREMDRLSSKLGKISA